MSEQKEQSKKALSPAALPEPPLRLTLGLPADELGLPADEGCAPEAPLRPVDEEPLSPLERPGWFQRPLDRR